MACHIYSEHVQELRITVLNLTSRLYWTRKCTRAWFGPCFGMSLASPPRTWRPSRSFCGILQPWHRDSCLEIFHHQGSKPMCLLFPGALSSESCSIEGFPLPMYPVVSRGCLLRDCPHPSLATDHLQDRQHPSSAVDLPLGCPHPCLVSFHHQGCPRLFLVSDLLQGCPHLARVSDHLLSCPCPSSVSDHPPGCPCPSSVSDLLPDCPHPFLEGDPPLDRLHLFSVSDHLLGCPNPSSANFLLQGYPLRAFAAGSKGLRH